MTLNLSHQEWDMLEALAEEQAMSKMAVLRNALRVYERVSNDQKQGRKLYIEDEKTKERTELWLIRAD